MKNLFLSLLFISGLAFGQKEFTMSPNEFTDYIVTETKGSKDLLYKKSIEWISKNYKNPDKVILSKIPGDFIRFQGIEDIYCNSEYNTCSPAKYTIELSFKDNKYKFDLISIDVNSGGGWNPTRLLSNPAGYFKKDGTPFDPKTLDIPKHFNQLNSKLSDYIQGKKSANW